MDLAQFSQSKTGQLVRIFGSMEDWAFVPAPLPPETPAYPDLVPQLMEAVDRLADLNGRAQDLPTPDLLLRPLQQQEALQSSKLEGTHATPEDVLLFVQNPREVKSESDPANNWMEVANYTKALQTGYTLLQKYPLSLNVIRQMHKALMTGVRGKDRNPGEFRRVQVAIGNRFVPVPPQHILPHMSELEGYLNKPVSWMDRLVRPFIAHYQFEAIHPFWDGNGRIGRALLALNIYLNCGHSMPWLYMSPYFDRHKDEYMLRLFRISTHGEWNEWLAFCLRGVVAQANDSITRCKMFKEIHRRYKARSVLGGSRRTSQIIEALFTFPVVSAPALKKRFSTTYPTAKADIEHLCRCGILRPISASKPASYFAWEIFKVAYSETPSLASDNDIKAVIESAGNAPPPPSPTPSADFTPDHPPAPSDH